MVTRLRNLPGDIATGLSDLLNDVLPGGDLGETASNARQRASDAVLGDDDSRRRQAANVVIGGGLQPFVESVQRDGSVDLA